MDPVVMLIIAVVVLLILLRIFFKLAKFVIFLGILLVIGIVVWNVLLR